MSFPADDTKDLEPMFCEIQDAIRKHLGFLPPACVLLVTDGEHAQTFFIGRTQEEMDQLLVEGATRHIINTPKLKKYIPLRG